MNGTAARRRGRLAPEPGQRASERRQAGFARRDLVVVVVALALTGVAAVLAFRPQIDSRRAVCASRLRDLGVAFQLYVDSDLETRYPRTGRSGRPLPSDWVHWQAGRDWKQSALAPFLPQIGPESLRCPADVGSSARAYTGSFSMNEHLERVRPKDALPAGVILLAEEEAPTEASWAPNVRSHELTQRHEGNAQVLFADGHVQVIQTNTKDRRF